MPDPVKFLPDPIKNPRARRSQSPRRRPALKRQSRCVDETRLRRGEVEHRRRGLLHRAGALKGIGRLLAAHAFILVAIDGEAGVGYRLHRGYQVPPMMFDQDELQALMFGAQVAKRWGDHDMAAAAERIIDKVDAVLPEKLRGELTAQTVVVPEMAGYQSEQTTRTLGATREAINERRRLYLSYTDAAGEPTERIVWPLTLVYWGNTWALGAWCELRQDFRNFRIDRIVEARGLTTQFPDEPGKRLEDYFAEFTDER